MSKKEHNQTQEENNPEEILSEETMENSVEENPADSKLEDLMTQLAEKTQQCEDYKNMLQRTGAEFDNYKKRTAREKEALYSEGIGDAVTAFLPVVDNMERALEACSKEGDSQALREGVEMIFKQLKDTIRNLDVEEIKSMGEPFDPNVHNAVMHIEDEAYGENEIVEEFQKGYKLKDKVLRHSMVKVAN